MKTISELAETYFKTLNPIAERITTDILTIKEAYEGLWNSLNEKERHQIINETVVHPEALLKYALRIDSTDGNSDLSIHAKVTGSKYVVDENTGVVWRDEHSAPFSWKTPSQINLSVFTPDQDSNQEEAGFTLGPSTKENLQSLDTAQTDKAFNLKLQTSTWSQAGKEKEKSDLEKNSLSPESNVVMVGTCSKLSGLCSKLKFLPSRSYSYEVQTVVSNAACSTADGSILNRLKSTAIHKIQNTLKFIGGRSADKKMPDTKEKDNLIDSKASATIIKITKASPKVSKPTSPPPPPPVFNSTVKVDQNGQNPGTNLIPLPSDAAQPQIESSSEKAALLDVDHSLEGDSTSRNDDNVDDESAPLSGSPPPAVIPKSGFDFLDNW